MAQPTRAKIKVSELFQVGVVVRDLENSMRHYESILGIGPWEVVEVDSSSADMTYHGKPVQHRFTAAITTLGSMQLELLQPVEGDNIYGDFLKEHGEGIHHLGHVRVDNVDEAVQTLETEGFPCIQGGRSPYHNWAYVDMTTALGCIIELSSGVDPRDVFSG